MCNVQQRRPASLTARNSCMAYVWCKLMLSSYKLMQTGGVPLESPGMGAWAHLVSGHMQAPPLAPTPLCPPPGAAPAPDQSGSAWC